MAASDIVEKHLKAFNEHDSATWANGYASDAVLYDPQYAEPRRGQDAFRKDIEDFFTAFPDIQFTTIGVVGSGDRAAIQGVGKGTHRGPMEGPSGTIEATNKSVEVPFGVFIVTNAEGLITEERRYYDMAGMLMQLGLLNS